MLEIWEKAKKNNEILYFKNFQKPEVTWDDVLQYVYDQSCSGNTNITEEEEKSGGVLKGNILFYGLYFFIRHNNLFPIFKGVKELMSKVNGGNSGENCSYYNNQQCNCDVMWHIQALRFSIDNHTVSDHNDPNDVLYWQLLGRSYWKMNNDVTYELEPGDLLYFNQSDSHQVFQDGPRSGIIIDAIKQRGFPSI